MRARPTGGVIQLHCISPSNSCYLSIPLPLLRFSSLLAAFIIINDAIEWRRGLWPAGAVPEWLHSCTLEDQKIEIEKETQKQISRGRERHKTVSERKRLLIVCSLTSLSLLFVPSSLILHPHPPLLSSILMAGLGGLTCLVIDGNVSGSHFTRQHPTAFHQAWCRGEPITRTLLTLCSLSARSLQPIYLRHPHAHATFSIHTADPIASNTAVERKLTVEQQQHFDERIQTILKWICQVGSNSGCWGWIPTIPLLSVLTTSIMAIRTWFQHWECFAMLWNY